jgi:hypothetical protein
MIHSAVAVVLLVLAGCGTPPVTDPSSAWTSTDAREVDAALLAVEDGPEHCEWQDTVFLTAKWAELGAPLEDPDVPYESYVRDPSSVELTGSAVHRAGYSPDAELPPTAIDIGYRSGDVELFVFPDGSAVYLAGSDRVERWPALQGGCA